jgi:hypothetical protein
MHKYGFVISAMLLTTVPMGADSSGSAKAQFSLVSLLMVKSRRPWVGHSVKNQLAVIRVHLVIRRFPTSVQMARLAASWR